MKHLKLYEEFTNESIKFKDLVDTKFYIQVGSGTSVTTWNKDDLIQEIKRSIKHNLFDSEFYYNWTDLGKEYSSIFEKETLSPMLKNIDRTLKEFFVLKGSTLTFTSKGKEFAGLEGRQGWIDNWFQTNKSISNSLRKDYYEYREKYAGVELN